MDLDFKSKIGQGIFAGVWLAKDNIGREVAVKFFDDTNPSQAEMNALNHARALARVVHPAVVRVLTVERQPHPESNKECLAIVMEYIPGTSLLRYQGSISIDLALSAIRDVCAAIDAIHVAGMVHGDLHDANIIVADVGAKVIDILYTHSLALVGTRTAAQTRERDIRDASVVARQILVKAGKDDASLGEAFYHATTKAKTAAEVGEIFAAACERQDPRRRALSGGSYYVNPRPQSNGDHEVHTRECQYYRSDFRHLGEYASCDPAVAQAKTMYPKANGCTYCSPRCHAN